MKKRIKKIMVIGGCIALIGATLTGCATNYTQDELNTQITAAEEAAKADGVKEGIASVDVEQIKADAISGVDITSDNEKAGNDAIASITIDQVPDAIQTQILADAKQAQDTVDADTDAKGYTLDELEIGVAFNKTLSDRELNLFDGEIRFDGDDYDAEEIFYLTNLKVAANEEDDWNTDTFLQIPEGGIRFAIEFASNLNTSLIDEDETLEFSFLGEEVEVSDWDGNEITFTKGTEVMFEEDINQTIDGNNILVDLINDDYIHVVVNGEGKKIKEGQTKSVGGIEIRAVSVMVNDEDDKTDKVDLEIGDDVEFTVKDGEEYADDSIWDYVVDGDARIFGLVLNEEHMSIDEDEDFRALAVGDSISLPNDYITVTYNGLTVEDTEDYDFKIKTKDNVKYVMVKGEFIDGINDYDRIYINGSGSIFDDDYELINVTSIELADTDLTLETNGVNITIESDVDVLVATNFTLDMLEVDGKDISKEDEDYITRYGIVVKDPEDNLEDFEVEIKIPEEELEAEIYITSK